MSTAWQLGTKLRHIPTGKVRVIARITPAGEFGTSFTDGPVFHVASVDEHGAPIWGGYMADVWHGSLSNPTSDWEAIP